ncbi:transmembrane protein dusky-like isoform X2 [Bombus vancouverensis nearcticus]|uniref:transmembrane protein dusky-like isoform X2 n=1 Tax=Bombus vancouverensis nearcticus TaxID=2705178 RepID=UPI00402BA950
MIVDIKVPAREETRMMERTWRSIRKSTLILLLPLLLARVNCEAPLVDSSALPLEHRSVYGAPAQYGPPATHGAEENWPLASPDTPQIKHLQVQCEKTHMRVNIEFDRPFYGMIFSKGFYSDPHCVHLKPGTGHLSATFEIFLNSCGMSSSANHNVAAYGAPTPSGSYVENTIIVQYDPYVQEVWDQARKLRCTWYDFYEKAVTFRPFQVDMLHAVTANFLGDNLQCWMQIQVGKGPWASEVSGIVKIGQTMTMVLAIKDDENKFDMLVRNCVAHDGKRAPIQLVDQYGCVVRPKIMSRFQKIKNFGPSASVVSFAYFQAFKFPDSMNVHFQCVIQVCRYNCPEPKCGHPGLEYGAPATALTQEYGAPVHQNLGAEYGAPPVPEYGVPPAFADPRHPSGPAGAYSEQNADVVPAPQAQTSSSSPSSTPGDATASSSPQSPQDNIHLPPPPLPGHPAGAYQTVKRKGTAGSEELEGNLATLGGRPRSVEGFPAELRGARRRRSADEHLHDDDSSIYRTVTLVSSHVYKRAAQEMTDVNTSRTIQVVAPGDVNFALGTTNSSNDTTVVIQNASASADPETICMSLPGFVGGLVMLLLVVVVASLVAAFLFVRVRAVDRKNIVAGSGFVHAAYAADNCSVPNPEFVKVAN